MRTSSASRPPPVFSSRSSGTRARRLPFRGRRSSALRGSARCSPIRFAPAADRCRAYGRTPSPACRRLCWERDGGSSRVNPYVFFVGCPRSGTTLLRRIGNAHPELAVMRELHWLPHWWERRVGLTAEGMVTPALVAKLRQHPRFERLEVDPADLDALLEDGAPKHYARFVTEVFDLHGKVKGKPRVGEKTPKYV